MAKYEGNEIWIVGAESISIALLCVGFDMHCTKKLASYYGMASYYAIALAMLLGEKIVTGEKLSLRRFYLLSSCNYAIGRTVIPFHFGG